MKWFFHLGEIQKYLDGTQAKEMELFLSCDDGHKGFANVRIGILGGEEDWNKGILIPFSVIVGGEEGKS